MLVNTGPDENYMTNVSKNFFCRSGLREPIHFWAQDYRPDFYFLLQ